MEQMKNRKEHEAAEKFANGLADEFRAFWADEDGVGVIEVVLILVVICTSRCPCVLCVYREIFRVMWNMIHSEEMFCVCSN